MDRNTSINVAKNRLYWGPRRYKMRYGYRMRYIHTLTSYQAIPVLGRHDDPPTANGEFQTGKELDLEHNMAS